MWCRDAVGLFTDRSAARNTVHLGVARDEFQHDLLQGALLPTGYAGSLGTGSWDTDEEVGPLISGCVTANAIAGRSGITTCSLV